MQNADNITQFDFGENWAEFSKNALTSEQVEGAKASFRDLIADTGIELNQNSFVDIGFGQGLSLLTATEMGAKTVGCDINPKCGQVLKANQRFFPTVEIESLPLVIGSILKSETVAKLMKNRPLPSSKYHIVHSWGVLHHTGEMWKAIDHASNLVEDNGFFILAIYNRHWSSKAWLGIKAFYNAVPSFLQKIMNYLFFPIIFLAKFAVTGRNPMKKERGMNFFYDIVDWVGGYPYEYASRKEIDDYLKPKGFECVKFIEPSAPTGCNQFVFRKIK